jgi:uncharacterized membrane protein YdcZ (DUF606 family)
MAAVLTELLLRLQLLLLLPVLAGIVLPFLQVVNGQLHIKQQQSVASWWRLYELGTSL